MKVRTVEEYGCFYSQVHATEQIQVYSGTHIIFNLYPPSRSKPDGGNIVLVFFVQGTRKRELDFYEELRLHAPLRVTRSKDADYRTYRGLIRAVAAWPFVETTKGFKELYDALEKRVQDEARRVCAETWREVERRSA